MVVDKAVPPLPESASSEMKEWVINLNSNIQNLFKQVDDINDDHRDRIMTLVEKVATLQNKVDDLEKSNN